eukprot:XP_011677061.1 PREDICTED: uncharacterized protein LOC105444467 [Strongylocentrotus purpuratus]
MSAVDLSSNKVTTINEDDFLPWINCSVGKFNFTSTSALRVLNMSGTHLKAEDLVDIQTGTSLFSGLVSLRTLTLRHNPLNTLHTLPGIFSPLGSLVELDLTSCRYHEITEDRTPEDYEYQLNLMFHEDDEWWVDDCMKPFLEQRMAHLERVILGDAESYLAMPIFTQDRST